MIDENDRMIIDRLDILIKLTAANVIRDKSLKDQVSLLSSVGLQPKEIADILGKTSNNIRVTLSMINKERKSKKKTENINRGMKDNE